MEGDILTDSGLFQRAIQMWEEATPKQQQELRAELLRAATEIGARHGTQVKTCYVRC
jgi:hypothetical protein